MADEISSPEGEQVPIVSETVEADIKLIVCTWCSGEKIKLCAKCNRPFCTLHSSRLTPILCQECFRGVSLVLDRFTRKTEDYDTALDTVITKTESCDRLRLDGPDWVWYTAWIHQLNDDELKIVFEFHYFVIKLIETANEQRKINKSQKLAATSIGVTKTTETKTKKVAKPVDMRKQLEKLGLPEAVIVSMLKAAGVTT